MSAHRKWNHPNIFCTHWKTLDKLICKLIFRISIEAQFLFKNQQYFYLVWTYPKTFLIPLQQKPCGLEWLKMSDWSKVTQGVQTINWRLELRSSCAQTGILTTLTLLWKPVPIISVMGCGYLIERKIFMCIFFLFKALLHMWQDWHPGIWNSASGLSYGNFPFPLCKVLFTSSNSIPTCLEQLIKTFDYC